MCVMRELEIVITSSPSADRARRVRRVVHVGRNEGVRLVTVSDIKLGALDNSTITLKDQRVFICF